MAPILSCGIPTSMPILPKEVVVKANPTVSVPLGGVNYNLYSGMSGGGMSGKRGSLDDIFPSWLEDLPEGVTIYDYRPAGDDGIQKFLVHYKLDMEGDLGSSGEFDLREYQDMIDELIGKPTTIEGVEGVQIPSIGEEKKIDVKINLGGVTDQLDTIFSKLAIASAYLPVVDGSKNYNFPDDISDSSKFPDEFKDIIDGNKDKEFFVKMEGLESLTLQQGNLNFDFTLKYGGLPLPSPALGEGSKLVLSGFKLRSLDGEPIPNVAIAGSDTVTLDSDGATGKLSINLAGVTLPQKFDLFCNLAITGKGIGYFELEIKPEFKAFTISGVKGLELTDAQISTFETVAFPETSYPIDKDNKLGPSFTATVGDGELEIGEIFPSLDSAGPNGEGWNLALDMSGLCMEQDSVFDTITNTNIEGLSLDGLQFGGDGNSLDGKTLNIGNVKIHGTVTASIRGGGKKLTFQNISPGIGNDGNDYTKQIRVNLVVENFSEVKVRAQDFGLKEDEVEQTIEQELGDDFTAFKPWLNYIKFKKPPDYGLGVALKIGNLAIPGGLGLFINAPAFGFNDVFQPLKIDENGEVIFLSGATELCGSDLPEDGLLPITVRLGLENQEDQQHYEDTGILTLRNIVPGDEIKLENATARLIFNWTEMAITPQKHINGPDDPLPDYPFAGTFPDKKKGEEGMDLSDMPKGLSFYIPGEGDAGQGVDARLYISLKRQSFIDGQWEDDPEDPGYDENDPDGWGSNLQVNLPNLDFRVIYSDDSKSDNLFSNEPNAQQGTGAWALPKSIGEILEDPENPNIKEDAENTDNPFKIYTAPSLPKMEKAIPLGNFAKALNDVFTGRKEGPLFFDYAVELAKVPGEEEGAEEPGEILLYPDILKKRIVASADLLALIPLVFQADPEAAEGSPVVVTIESDLEDEDLFQRKAPDDNEYFDMITSFGFDIVVDQVAGLDTGTLYLENKTDVKEQQYRLPLFDFANPRNNLSLDSAEVKKIKAIWPFVPQASIEFERGAVVRIERNFNIKLQSVTVRAGGEYTFETGL
jgi:hypothetical protein